MQIVKRLTSPVLLNVLIDSLWPNNDALKRSTIQSFQSANQLCILIFFLYYTFVLGLFVSFRLSFLLFPSSINCIVYVRRNNPVWLSLGRGKKTTTKHETKMMPPGNKMLSSLAHEQKGKCLGARLVETA